jgi:hypothetical protein
MKPEVSHKEERVILTIKGREIVSMTIEEAVDLSQSLLDVVGHLDNPDLY